MKRKVIRKQPNSKMCLVCGLKNPLGLKAHFYELENKELVGIFEPIEEHQGYPGRLHGGIISAILDETIGRSILINYEEDVWFVTVEFNVRFKKPVPLDEEVKVRARLTKETSRIYEGTGEIILKNEEVAAEGYGKYMKLPIEKIADFDYEEQEWRVVSAEKDPEEIEI
ncbi:MAG: PaaI family thioesterase [candidate division WOR-3 bacterium]|jgi:acyl-coenzyme A thioesterase PaaI-like protein